MDTWVLKEGSQFRIAEAIWTRYTVWQPVEKEFFFFKGQPFGSIGIQIESVPILVEMLIIHFYERTDKMRLIYAEYNPHTNSIDVTTFKNFILRMYNLKMTMRHIL